MDDSAYAQGLGCYTTARIERGAPRLLALHAARLSRDAERLGIGAVDPAAVARALAETGAAAFPDADGVVRVQASRDASGAIHLTATPRVLGSEPSSWRAARASFRHEGPMPWGGAKVTNHLLFVLAAQEASRSGVDEALLFDREGYLIEGARTNLVIVNAEGLPALPDLARGGVAGIARQLVRERFPEIAIRNVPETEVRGARELIAINAVRGARPCVALDGQPVGSGEPGPWAERLDDCLARA